MWAGVALNTGKMSDLSVFQVGGGGGGCGGVCKMDVYGCVWLLMAVCVVSAEYVCGQARWGDVEGG